VACCTILYIYKNYTIYNNTTGGFAITVKTSSGTTISVPNGQYCSVYVNSTAGVIQASTYFPVFASPSVSITGGTISGVTLSNYTIVLNNGTAAAPSFSFSNSATTGLYSVSANVIGVTVGGSQVGTFTATGIDNMSIGATTPASGTFSTLYLKGVTPISQGYIPYAGASNLITYDNTLAYSNSNLLLGTSGTSYITSLNLTGAGIQFPYSAIWSSNLSGIGALQIQNNLKVSSGNYSYISTAGASLMSMSGGSFAFYVAPSGTAGTAVSFVLPLTFNSSGSWGIGGSPSYGSANQILQSNGNAALPSWTSLITLPGVVTASTAVVSSMRSTLNNTTVNSTTYGIVCGSSPGAIIFYISLSNGDGCLASTTFLSSTITFLGTPANIVNSASPTSSQLGVSKSAGSSTVTVTTGSSLSSTISTWSMCVLSGQAA
jgi:hypothetical protein